MFKESGVTGPEAINLYQERPYRRAREYAQQLKSIEDGTMERIELTKEERLEVLDFENKTGQELKERFTNLEGEKSLFFYPEYLTTANGQEFMTVALQMDEAIENIKKELTVAGADPEKLADPKITSGIVNIIAESYQPTDPRSNDTTTPTEKQSAALQKKFNLPKDFQAPNELVPDLPEIDEIIDTDDVATFTDSNPKTLAKLSESHKSVYAKLIGFSYRQAMFEFLGPVQEAIAKDPTSSKQIDELDLKNPEKRRFVLTPEKLLKKLTTLRKFKQEMKSNYRKLKEDPTNVNQSKQKILNLYARHLNKTEAMMMPIVFDVARKAQRLGYENLQPAEQELIKTGFYFKAGPDQEANQNQIKKLVAKIPRHGDRYDKFIYGATSEYIDDLDSPRHGDRQQFSKDLLEKAQAMQEFYAKEQPQRMETTSGKAHYLEEKGWDRDKVIDNKIDAPHFVKWVQDFFKSKGIAAIDPEDTKNWDAFVDDNTTTIFVGRDKRVHVHPNYKSSIDLAVPTVRHELTHANQALNRENILGSTVLELTATHKGGQSTVCAEGGAMAQEKALAGELFGIEKRPLPVYAFAIAKKLEGGDFRDAYKEVLKSQLEVINAKWKSGLYKTESERDQAIDRMTQATFSRVLRPFFGSTNLDSGDPYLGSSASTSYIEQELLAEYLAENEMVDYLVAGLSPETIIDLYQAGIIDNPRENLTVWTEEEILAPIKDDLKKYRLAT